MEEHLQPSSLSAAGGMTWIGLLGGPLAWFASQQLRYALVPWACHGGPQIAIPLTNLVALLLVGLAGAVAWRDWRSAGPESSRKAAQGDRARFLGAIGLLQCALFSLVIVVQTIAAFIFDPCQQ